MVFNVQSGQGFEWFFEGFFFEHVFGRGISSIGLLFQLRFPGVAKCPATRMGEIDRDGTRARDKAMIEKNINQLLLSMLLWIT